ncbi:uncharacterized protein [Ptychodera flava]|uniref:uncharacterized protein n=1 Tax=Ptychodera flava TaxID=63121 RepID=UPI00396A6BDF
MFVLVMHKGDTQYFSHVSFFTPSVFSAKFVATEEYVTSYNGSVFSPLHPFPYPTNITYTTKISTPEGTVVTLGFTELHLRRGDNVSVYDDGAKLILAFVHGDDPGIETVIYALFTFSYIALRACVATDDENGEIYPEEDYYLPGEVVTVVCHTGFEPSTSYNVTCEEGGSWDAEVPACIKVSNGSNIIAIVVITVSILVITALIILCLMYSRSSKSVCLPDAKRDQKKVNRNETDLVNDNDYLSRRDGRSSEYSNEGVMKADADDHTTKSDFLYSNIDDNNDETLGVNQTRTEETTGGKNAKQTTGSNYMELVFTDVKPELTEYSLLQSQHVESGEIKCQRRVFRKESPE